MKGKFIKLRINNLIFGWMSLFAAVICPRVQVFSQQDPMYSQYMFNGIVVNPAYTGSREALSAMLLIRKQWVGISGAPLTQNFSIHSPTRNRKSAFGLIVVNDRISYLGQTWINGTYAYKIQTGKTGKISLGLQGTIYNYRINWEKAKLIEEGDIVITNYGRNYLLPNAGFGIYYSSKRAYAGISVPRMLVNTFENGKTGVRVFSTDTSFASLKRHYFATAGYLFSLSDDVKLKSSFLIKYVDGSIPQADVNLNAYFLNRFGIGFSYRSGDGLVGIAEFQINPQFRIGYAYDYPFFTALRGFTSGSHEIMLGYDFFYDKDEVVSPRFF